MSRERFLGFKSWVLAGFLLSAIVLGAAGTRIVAGPSSMKWERDYDKAHHRGHVHRLVRAL